MIGITSSRNIYVEETLWTSRRAARGYASWLLLPSLETIAFVACNPSSVVAYFAKVPSCGGRVVA